MSGKGPNILIVAVDRDERAAITALLRQAGFAVAAVAADRGATGAMRRERFAAAVIAQPGADGVKWIRRLRSRQLGLRALLVAEPAALPLIDADCGTFVSRPFDPRQLLGCLFELVMRDDQPASAPPPNRAAELIIAAARVACLYNRRAVASAAGASRLAQELTREIGAMRANCRGAAGARAISGISG